MVVVSLSSPNILDRLQYFEVFNQSLKAVYLLQFLIGPVQHHLVLNQFLIESIIFYFNAVVNGAAMRHRSFDLRWHIVIADQSLELEKTELIRHLQFEY